MYDCLCSLLEVIYLDVFFTILSLHCHVIKYLCYHCLHCLLLKLYTGTKRESKLAFGGFSIGYSHTIRFPVSFGNNFNKRDMLLFTLIRNNSFFDNGTSILLCLHNSLIINITKKI